MLVHARGKLRARAGDGHGAQGATRGVEAGVERGQRRRQNDDLDDGVGVGHAQAGEEGDERRLGRRVGRVGQDERHEDDRAHVEDEDADDHRVDGAREALDRVGGGLAGRHAHHLGAAERVDHAKRQREDRREPRGQKAAVLGDVGDARVRAAHRRAQDDAGDSDNHEDDDGGHLDDGKPKLCLAVHLHAHHVQHEDKREGHERDDPLGHGHEDGPVVHIEGHRRDVGHDRRRPVEEEQPARDVGALLAEELARVGDEGARGGAAHGQLA